MRADGWRAVLAYLALENAAVSAQRVAERVRGGGHDIQRADIRRRFPRSLSNLFNAYERICDHVACYDNTGEVPEVVFEQSGESLRVYDTARFEHLNNEARI